MLSANPNENFTSLDGNASHLYVVSKGGSAQVSWNAGVTFHEVSFGDVEWMPPFAPAPRSALNIVLGTSVVIPGRTAAADLIRRPRPTRTEPPWYHPGPHDDIFTGIRGYGRVGKGVYLGLGKNIFFKHSPSQLFQFDQEIDLEFLEGGAAEDNPAFWLSPWIVGLPRADFWFSRRDSQVNPQWGTGSARHLNRALLFNPAKEHGDGEVLVDPTRPKRAFILTSQGVFRSDDGGRSFRFVFSAPQESCCSAGGFAENGDFYVVGTKTIFRSEDGESFLPAGNHSSSLVKRLNAQGRMSLLLPVESVTFQGDQPQSNVEKVAALWVGSPDFSESVSSYGRDTPPGELFATKQGLRYKTEEGELLPIGGEVVSRGHVGGLVHDPHDASHVVVALGSALLESWDGASSFTLLAKAPGEGLGLRADLATYGSVLVLTAKAVFRLGPEVPAVQDYAVVSMLRRALQTEPPLHQVLIAAQKKYVPIPSNRVFLKDIFPIVKVVGGGIYATSVARLNATFISASTSGNDRGDLTVGIGLEIEPTILRSQKRWQGFAGPNLAWDLPSLMMPVTLPRRVREAKNTFKKVQKEVTAAHLTRRILMREMAFSPPNDGVAQLHLTLRIDEMTAKLNALSGLFADTPSFVPKKLRRHISSRVSLDKILKKSTNHFHVNESRQAGRRTRAFFKGAVPVLQVAGGVWGTYMEEPFYNLELLDEASPWIIRNAESVLFDANVMLAWDLRRLVFDTQVLDVMRLSHIRRIVQKEAIELHYSGLRLEAELALSRRHSDVDRMMLEIQLEEIHKRVEALTGQSTPEPGLAEAKSRTPFTPFSLAARSSRATSNVH
ncbi:MAG: hypothetical protein GY822_04090 [Deltaproteobacteria bacterium]|nr:hypothetical protein [Deltaproteobacteria bacterium]